MNRLIIEIDVTDWRDHPFDTVTRMSILERIGEHLLDKADDLSDIFNIAIKVREEIE